jgi:hypothetical protein
MATTFTWDIQNVDLLDSHNGNEDVVFRVVWQCTATADNGKTKSQIGIVELDVNNTSTEFISVAEVTKEMIINWVKSSVAVKVIEDGLVPNIRTLTFGNNTDGSVTVAEVLVSNQADAENPPTPTPTT